MAWIRMTGGKPVVSTKYILKNGILQDNYTDNVNGTNTSVSRTTTGGARKWTFGTNFATNCFYIEQAIDVTNYSKLIFEASTASTRNPHDVYDTKYAGLSLVNTAPAEFVPNVGFKQSYAVSATLPSANNNISTYELDVSNLTGSYYFCANVNCNASTATLSLFNVYLVK